MEAVPDVETARTNLEAAGCSFKSVKALEGVHSIQQPGGTSDKWNTDPPTTGPHYGIAAIFGIYEDELEIARVVHNLEHGGIFILYGEDVPDATVDELRAFYDDHKTGTIMAPLDRLGDEFALGAWVVDGEVDNGFLAGARSSTRVRCRRSSPRSSSVGPSATTRASFSRATSADEVAPAAARARRQRREPVAARRCIRCIRAGGHSCGSQCSSSPPSRRSHVRVQPSQGAGRPCG